MKHNTRRLTVGSEATILLDIVSSSQLVMHSSVGLVKETSESISIGPRYNLTGIQ